MGVGLTGLVALMVLAGVAMGCGGGRMGEDDDDDDIASADGDADADGDGDGDADADADGDGDVDMPDCEPRSPASASVGIGAIGRAGVGGGPEMVVVRSDREGLGVEEDYLCNPFREMSLEFRVHGLPEEAWFPAVGSQVQADVLVQQVAVSQVRYGSIRTREGVLIFEGGVSAQYGLEVPRFQVIDDPDALWCKVDECWSQATLRASVQTDEGPVELTKGDPRIVTVEGEPFLAVLTSASDSRLREIEECVCLDCLGGPWVSGYIARTTAVDTPVDPATPPSGDCPAEMPMARQPCTTAADLTCPYDQGAGCWKLFACRACLWSLEDQFGPDGVDCGF